MKPYRPVLSGRRVLLPCLLAASLAGQAQAADLLTITRDAIDNNASLASARAQRSSVEEGRNVERGDLLPQVSATGDVAHNRLYDSIASTQSASTGNVDDSYNSASLTLEATQALL